MSDLIDRQAILKHIEKIRQDALMMDDIRIASILMTGMTLGEEVVRNQPSAQPERKKGTWTNDASCPFCGFQPWYERDIHTLSFCPNCGADMRGGDAE